MKRIVRAPTTRASVAGVGLFKIAITEAAVPPVARLPFEPSLPNRTIPPLCRNLALGLNEQEEAVHQGFLLWLTIFLQRT